MHAPAPASSNPLLSAPILPTLWRLSLPNMVAMLATAVVAIAETAYVGILGTPPLAGMALVFPMVMLQQMMSAGAMGGGISSAVSRALGARNQARAEALALHALVIGTGAGVALSVFFLMLGAPIYRLLGGSGEALTQALIYSNTFFVGTTAVWLTNTFASVIRGSGNMKMPSLTLLGVAVLQVLIGGTLGLGLGPFPRLGMAGIALGQLIAFSAGALFLLWYLCSGRAQVRLTFRPGQLNWEMFRDILRVGALAAFSPLQSVLTILVITRLVAGFGTETLAGYGIGARLEFLLVPIAFAIGVASVPMVGMAIGAGLIDRARRVARAAGATAAVLLGSVGLVVAFAPDVWTGLFTQDPSVSSAARLYFLFAGPCYAFYGIGMSLYFASQGAGKVLGPVLAQSTRLLTVILGGAWLSSVGAEPWTMFALVGIAMVVYGLATALSVYLASWNPKSAS